MLLKSEHKEGGGSRDTMEQSELSQAMETKKKRILVFESQIYFYSDYHWPCKVNWRQFIYTVLKQNWKILFTKRREKGFFVFQ